MHGGDLQREKTCKYKFQYIQIFKKWILHFEVKFKPGKIFKTEKKNLEKR